MPLLRYAESGMLGLKRVNAKTKLLRITWTCVKQLSQAFKTQNRNKLIITSRLTCY